MIEIIYNEKKQGSTTENGIFHLPNNIRQIGETRPHLKIYMEDYAYTYLKRMSGNHMEGGCAAILLGEARWEESVSYIFIRSALGVENMEIAEEHMDFKDAVWSQIHKDMEQFFPEQEIIGWSLSLPNFNMEISDLILKTHLNHFAGNQKVLFAMEPTEKEEAFFVYDNGKLNRQNGYYIYYEKNEQMQAYMIEKNGNTSIEDDEKVPDRAVVDFRKIVAGKKERDKKEKGGKSYLTAVCAAAVVVALGFTYVNHYRTVQEVADTAQENEMAMTSGAEQSGSGNDKEKLDANPADDMQEKDNSMNDTGQDNTDQTGTDTENAGETAASDESDIPEETSATDNVEKNKTGDSDTDSEDKVNQENNQTDTSSAPTPTAETEKRNETPASAGVRQKYVVQKGDTLSKISKTYYGSTKKIQDICQLNQLDSEDLIYAGQIILLP